MNTTWRDVVSAVAPTIATALGGPLAGSAVGALARTILGKDSASDAELEQALAHASPDTLAKLKQTDADYKLGLANAGVKLAELDADDRASARARESDVKDYTPRIIASLVVFSWIGAEFVVFMHVIEPTMRDFAMRLLGTLDMALGLVLAYYFGSSSSASQQHALISKALDKNEP